MLLTHRDGETDSQRKSAGERNIGNQDRRGMGREGEERGRGCRKTERSHKKGETMTLFVTHDER
jgi:hypothetical protein